MRGRTDVSSRVAGEFQKEVDNTTVLLDDILSILALLEAGDWSEHCTKTELGGRLEREITRLIGDAQEATVTSYELIAEAAFDGWTRS